MQSARYTHKTDAVRNSMDALMEAGVGIAQAHRAIAKPIAHAKAARAGIRWCTCPTCTCVLTGVSIGENTCRHCGAAFAAQAAR
jgi:hypothetical protein